jgi:hypothetical protein
MPYREMVKGLYTVENMTVIDYSSVASGSVCGIELCSPSHTHSAQHLFMPSMIISIDRL